MNHWFVRHQTIIDSDDYLTDDAVRFMENTLKSLPGRCIGILVYRKKEKGPLASFANKNMNQNTLRGFYDAELMGDALLIFRTAVKKI